MAIQKALGALLSALLLIASAGCERTLDAPAPPAAGELLTLAGTATPNCMQPSAGRATDAGQLSMSAGKPSGQFPTSGATGSAGEAKWTNASSP
jgi:hypothetical protein